MSSINNMKIREKKRALSDAMQYANYFTQEMSQLRGHVFSCSPLRSIALHPRSEFGAHNAKTMVDDLTMKGRGKPRSEISENSQPNMQSLFGKASCIILKRRALPRPVSERQSPVSIED